MIPALASMGAAAAPLLGAAATAPFALAQGIGGLIPSKYDKENKRRLEELQTLEATGRLGLTDQEYQRRANDMMSPARAAATGVANSQARALAVGGKLSGGDLSAMRRDQGQMLGNAGMQIKSALDQADEAKAAAQREELDQRAALRESRRKERVAGAFSALKDTAGAAGALMGAPPGTLTAFGAGGAQPTTAINALQGVDMPAQYKTALDTMLKSPDASRIMAQALAGNNLDDPRVGFARAMLEQARINQASGQTGFTATIPDEYRDPLGYSLGY